MEKEPHFFKKNKKTEKSCSILKIVFRRVVVFLSVLYSNFLKNKEIFYQS